MKKQSEQLQPKILNRRSFFTKSAFASVGLLFAPYYLQAFPKNSLKNKRTKEEVYNHIEELLAINQRKFGTCSQTSFHTLNEVFNLKAGNITKGLASFPGVAMRGETCGAVSGSMLAIGLTYEEDIDNPECKKGLSRVPSIKFCTAFENKYGSTQCRGVIEKVSGEKIPLFKPEDYKILAEKGVYKHCPGVIKTAVMAATDIILENIIHK